MKVLLLFLTIYFFIDETSGLKCVFGMRGMQSAYSKMADEQLEELTNDITRLSNGEITSLPDDDQLTEFLTAQAPDNGFTISDNRECEINYEGAMCSIAEAQISGIKVIMRTCSLVKEVCGLAGKSLPGELHCTDCDTDHCNILLGEKEDIYKFKGKTEIIMRSTNSIVFQNLMFICIFLLII